VLNNDRDMEMAITINIVKPPPAKQPVGGGAEHQHH